MLVEKLEKLLLRCIDRNIPRPRLIVLLDGFLFVELDLFVFLVCHPAPTARKRPKSYLNQPWRRDGRGAQIYGDGVNVAARLESLAELGGICISSTVHDQVSTKLALNYADLG